MAKAALVMVWIGLAGVVIMGGMIILHVNEVVYIAERFRPAVGFGGLAFLVLAMLGLVLKPSN